MLSKLEFILADGTAARYEGSRNSAGEPHGPGSMINAKGEVVRGPHWVDGAQDGEGFFLHIDGEKYTGHFKNGFKHGYGTHLFPDGELYEGMFRLNRKHGCGKQRWDDGYIFEGMWTHDEQNGWGIEYTKSGKISACGRWKDSELKEWHAVPRSVIPVGTYLNEKAKVRSRHNNTNRAIKSLCAFDDAYLYVVPLLLFLSSRAPIFCTAMVATTRVR